jgi:hypothetical protein
MSGITSGSMFSEPPLLLPPVVAVPLGRFTGASGSQANTKPKSPRQTGAVRLSHTRICQNYWTIVRLQAVLLRKHREF